MNSKASEENNKKIIITTVRDSMYEGKFFLHENETLDQRGNRMQGILAEVRRILPYYGTKAQRYSQRTLCRKYHREEDGTKF